MRTANTGASESAGTLQAASRPAPVSLAGLKIGLMIYGDIRQRTGGTIYDRELVRHLKALGATWSLLSLRDPRVPSGGGDTVASTLSRLRAEKFDVLLQDELCHPALNEINRALREEPRPLRIAIVHNLGKDALPPDARENCEASERQFLRSVHGCVANSSFTLREVTALVGDVAPSIAAYPSVNPDMLLAGDVRLPASSGAEGTRLLSVANLSAVKGVHHLLDALASVRDSSWTLELVGSTTRDVPYAGQIQRQIEALRLGERVRMAGELRGASLRAAYGRADVMVLASPQEGFGIACLEAMRCGLPVIASAKGAAPELIDHEQQGLLVDPTDHVAFVRTLRRVLDSPPLLHSLGTAARERASRHPTWESTASRVATFLLELHSTRTA